MKISISDLAATTNERHLLIPRLIAGLPLLFIGAGHLFDQRSFISMLEAAHFPMPALNALVAPGVEIVAGALLLAGLWTRLGGLLGASTMVAALFAHAVVDPTTLSEGVMMPPIILPLAVLTSALYLVWRGGGRWSLDARGASLWPVETQTPAPHTS